ncbi:MAG: hypothetical protein KIT14_07535 [bacterium]|nr:hypothetical protein [bacterium]
MHGPVTLVVEGATDEAVARRLLREARLEAGPVYGKAGKQALDARLGSYNRAARFSHWLVLRDLDEDAPCAPELSQALLPAPAPYMRLQVAVRAVEAWLIADGESLGTFLSVARAKVPDSPETLTDPKRELVELARRSRRRAVREAFVPAPGVSAAVGPGYSAALIEFASRQWRPRIAASRSESLARLRRYLRQVSQSEG